MNIAPFSYRPVTPAGYVCTGCGASGCKLWRQYQTFAEHIQLLCAKCSGADISTLDANGTVESTIFKRGEKVSQHGTGKVGVLGDPDFPVPRTDQLGGLMPAVPTENGDTYWGYTSTPDEGCRWWKSLDSQPKVTA
jgi:hypothetical protein